jgi:peptidoglycan/xylan/chitin deacetylase (PgdA/CDA1 family)
VIRHLLAPVSARAATALHIPRTVAQAGVALTFDDGPHPEGTPAVLELLERAGAKATFFMVGEQVDRRPQLAAEVAARGHLVALHAYRHSLQVRMSRGQIEADIARGMESLERAIHSRPVLHRPPYGIYSPWGLRTVRRIGLSQLLWSRWGKDWRGHSTPESIAALAVNGVSPGDVILLHDADFYSSPCCHRQTAKALELILGRLESREIATVLPV